jgi:hypothetical protein
LLKRTLRNIVPLYKYPNSPVKYFHFDVQPDNYNSQLEEIINSADHVIQGPSKFEPRMVKIIISGQFVDQYPRIFKKLADKYECVYLSVENLLKLNGISRIAGTNGTN